MGQLLWVNVTLIAGVIAGIKFSDWLFWDEDIKYKVWEEVETSFWE